jgi:TRAP transporter TAXI family solute receptor
MRLRRALSYVAIWLGLAGTAHAQSVGIATSNPGSLFHNIGSAVAKVANENGLNATIQPATSPNQYLPVVNAGEIEFGVSNLAEFTSALQGTEHFDGRPHPDLRAIGLIFPLRVAIFVRADSDIRTIADLKGRRMPDGFTAQKVILPLLDAEYATAGLSRDDLEPVQVPSVVGGADAFMSGETDGFFFALGAGKVREADAAVGGIRALPIADSEKSLDAIQEHFPFGYLRAEGPGPANPGVGEAMHVLAYPQLIFASTSTSDEAAYQLAKVLYENKEGMAAVFPPFNLFDPDAMAADIQPAQYHPGAIAFFREQGIWPGD